jgi:hypothetical protein
MPELTAQRAALLHRESTEAAIDDVVRYLQDLFGQRLVGIMAGVRDPKSVGRWASKETTPRAEAERRLRDTFAIARLLLTDESPHTLRAWFVGLNPQLDDESPAAAISKGRTRDVLVAAKSYLAGG